MCSKNFKIWVELAHISTINHIISHLDLPPPTWDVQCPHCTNIDQNSKGEIEMYEFIIVSVKRHQNGYVETMLVEQGENTNHNTTRHINKL
jgi:hypothetical protein